MKRFTLEARVRDPLTPKRKVFFLCFFFTIVTGPRRSLSPKLGDTRVSEPQIRAQMADGELLAGPASRRAPGAQAWRTFFSSSSLLLSSLELSESMSLKHEPSSEPRHISAK